jgi:outer membrane protein
VKNASLILNGVLLVAVIGLYVLHFKGQPATVAAKLGNTKADSIAAMTLPVKPGEIKASDIVYVNIDTLDTKYQYILDNSKVMNARQTALQSEYQRMADHFQKDYEDYQKSAQAGVLSGEALEKVKEQLGAEQGAVTDKQNQLRGLEMDAQRKQQDMLKKLADFLARYNAEPKYRFILPYSGSMISVLHARKDLDITNDVLNGLNAEYKKSKAGK